MKEALLALLPLIACAASAHSETPAQPKYDLALTLRAGDTILARPRLTLRAGEDGQVLLDNGHGQKVAAWINLTQVDEGKLFLNAHFDVQSAQTGQVAADPKLIIAFDEPASLSFGVKSSTQQPFSVDVLVIHTT